MKLNLHATGVNLAGYLNIDVTKYSIDLGNLNDICEDAECTYIIIDDILRFIPYNRIPEVVQHLFTKLRHKGTILFVCDNLEEILRQFQVYDIDEKQLNHHLFKQGSRSCFSYNYLAQLIKLNDGVITKVSFNNTQMIIQAERK